MTGYEWIKVMWNKNYAPHYMACCSHLDNETMLLVLGVPVYLVDDQLREYFSTFGAIANVSSQEKPSAVPKFHIPNNSKFFRNHNSDSSFRCTYIQYENTASLQKCLQHAKMVRLIILTSIGAT